MSDLQVGLLVIGAAIVIAVLLYNWIQERRFRRQADAAFQTPMADVLMQPDVVPRETHKRVEPALREPVFGTGMAGGVGEAIEPHLQVEPVPPADEASPDVAQDHPVPPAYAPPRAAAFSDVLPLSPYDELIEYRVRIGGRDGVRGSGLDEAFNHARTLGKTVRWTGLPAGETQWEDVQPWRGVHYQQVVVTVQLADRNGAVEEEQLTALCGMLQAMAKSQGLIAACDDVDDALERAQAIDRFCVDVDVLIGLNVVARGEGVVNLARIVHEAESSGMVLGADGVFQLLDSRGEPLYALCNYDAEPFGAEVADGQASQGITLQFDVPRVPDGLKVFDGMVAFGRRVASEVGGVLVDDNLRPLTDAGIEKIRGQLMQIYERMEARGVPSGSRRSLRLFS
ncbi:MAG: cell division protein ZipA C-terminal FtsZ-binding domain-containing protein [Thiobacillus sp.]|jgi:FtsZ-interacting cell division protein ZipA|uniref:cell division protein ZipA C-terminal FtsZ-binding domain-containing protein n=1 Tax=Thiobacillus sp. TaxID=924 RepID=UPI002894D586|nr:cell division protein ZipA C-terminal FtsZ-binding domain-containing protein [Thiobacillus sp.]MDT3707964.1 cell division protein ZipA C-terminal FtsZ-binding domain-containing protein [Thiobacillus sp.]